jgi:cytochrome c oxidase subunit IV
MGHRTVATRTLMIVGGALILLTCLTIALSYADLGPLKVPVALGIAIVKAGLIVSVFMELKFAAPVERLVAGAALLWLAILIGGTLDDYLTRGWLTTVGH